MNLDELRRMVAEHPGPYRITHTSRSCHPSRPDAGDEHEETHAQVAMLDALPQLLTRIDAYEALETAAQRVAQDICNSFGGFVIASPLLVELEKLNALRAPTGA